MRFWNSTYDFSKDRINVRCDVGSSLRRCNSSCDCHVSHDRFDSSPILGPKSRDDWPSQRYSRSKLLLFQNPTFVDTSSSVELGSPDPFCSSRYWGMSCARSTGNRSGLWLRSSQLRRYHRSSVCRISAWNYSRTKNFVLLRKGHFHVGLSDLSTETSCFVDDLILSLVSLFGDLSDATLTSNQTLLLSSSYRTHLGLIKLGRVDRVP